MEKSNFLEKYYKKLPDSSGVYFFLKGKEILYIGKATSLKKRVNSYFSEDLIIKRSPLISKMIILADKIDFQKTNSVLEALILEANLIKKHQPKYNSKDKDDKSYNYIIFTKEEFPAVLLARGKDIDGQYFKGGKSLKEISFKAGPFPSGISLSLALKIIRKIFPFRDKCSVSQGKPCFNHQIGLCPGVCVSKINIKEYNKNLKGIKDILSGNLNKLKKDLKKEMENFSKRQEFEMAGEARDKIFALEHIQDISLIRDDIENLDSKNFRIEGYDIAHTSGKDVVGVMTVLESGKIEKSDYRKFKLRKDENNDTRNLGEVLRRRLSRLEWNLPNLIVVDGGLAQKNIAIKILKENNIKIPVVSVLKNEKHKPKAILGKSDLINKYKKEILLVNNEAHRFSITYHKKLRGKIK